MSTGIQFFCQPNSFYGSNPTQIKVGDQLIDITSIAAISNPLPNEFSILFDTGREQTYRYYSIEKSLSLLFYDALSKLDIFSLPTVSELFVISHIKKIYETASFSQRIMTVEFKAGITKSYTMTQDRLNVLQIFNSYVGITKWCESL